MRSAFWTTSGYVSDFDGETDKKRKENKKGGRILLFPWSTGDGFIFVGITTLIPPRCFINFLMARPLMMFGSNGYWSQVIRGHPTGPFPFWPDFSSLIERQPCPRMSMKTSCCWRRSYTKDIVFHIRIKTFFFFFCSFGCDYISEVDWVRPLVVCFFPPVYDGLMVCFELVNWKAAGDIV